MRMTRRRCHHRAAGGAPPAAELVVAPSGSAKGRTPAVAEESEYEEEVGAPPAA